MTNKRLIPSVEQIESQIFLVRGQRVIRELMTTSDPKKKRPIGFAPWEKK